MTEQESIITLVDALPEKSITTLMLQGLDYVVPGQWAPARGFDGILNTILGPVDEGQRAAIRTRVMQDYIDPAKKYAKAVNLYRLVDKADVALGAAALADRIGDRINFLNFLDRLTPKADTVQAIDLAVKLACEAVGFTTLKGLKYDNLKAFGDALAQYSGASAMRLAALVCVDGVIPLGPDFVSSVSNLLKRSRPVALQNSPVFKRVSTHIPGGDEKGQMKFVQGTLEAAQDWTNKFVKNKGLTRQNLVNNLNKVIQISDEVLDYLGAFLDASTNYMEYTGIQTVAQTLIKEAAG